MSSKKKKTANASKNLTSDGHSYLTKRTIVTKARAAGLKAASTAMDIMGFVVVAKGNSIVRKYADGKEVVIGKIETSID